MRYIWFLAAYLIFFQSSGVAQTAALWNCSLTAQLHGDAHYYLNYGTDSWTGHGHLQCFLGATKGTKSVDITYHGVASGYGVNVGSVLNLDMRLVTSVTPHSWSVYADVVDLDPKGGVFWHIERSATLIEAVVTTDDFRSIQRSLQRGTLYIR